MLISAAIAPITLDITTFFVIATCITALLGLLLLSAWMQERVRALAWWGSAYLLGGFSVAVWSIEGLISPPLPPGDGECALVRRLRHDLERRAHLPRPQRALGHDVRRRDRVARGLPVSGIRAIGRRAHRAELDHRFRVHLPDRGGALARAPQDAAAALAGDLRADPARRRFPVPDSARQRAAGRWRHREPRERMDRHLRARDHALCGGHRLHRAGARQGAQRAHPARRGLDRRDDRAAQPARLLRRRPPAGRAPGGAGASR